MRAREPAGDRDDQVPKARPDDLDWHARVARHRKSRLGLLPGDALPPERAGLVGQAD